MAIENKEAVQIKLDSDKMQLLKICNQSSLTHDEIVSLYFDYCTSESEDSRSLLYMMTPRDIFNSVCSGEIRHIHSDTKIDVMIDDYMNNNKDNKMKLQEIQKLTQDRMNSSDIADMYTDYCMQYATDNADANPHDMLNKILGEGAIKDKVSFNLLAYGYDTHEMIDADTHADLKNANEEMKDKLIATAVRSSNARKNRATLDDIVEQSTRSPRLRDNKYEGTTRKDCKQLGVNSHEPARWVVLLAAIVLIAVMSTALYKATGTHSYYIQDDRLGYIIKTDKMGK